MKEIIVATQNKGKIIEYRALLEDLGYTVYSLLDFDPLTKIKEKGKTLFANAMFKAKTVADKYKMAAIADDSGLEVEALGGRPGVKSKRFSLCGTDEGNNRLLLRKLRNKDNRKARFVCQIVYHEPETGFRPFSGEIAGEIAKRPVKGNGFGYDPLFYIPELGRCLSELSVAEKNQISHRGIAFQKLRQELAGKP